MHEFALAFGSERPPEWAVAQVALIRTTIGDAVDVESRVQELDPPALESLATAFFELYTVACREYWTA
jgi:hypothetical protein